MSDELIIRATWDTRGVKKLMREMTPPRINQALSVAVNTTARQVERKAEQLVAKALLLPSKRVQKGIWIRPSSTPATLTAIVRGSGSVIPLKVFSAKEKGPGVTAKIWGATQFYAGAFMFGGPKTDHNRALKMGGHVFRRAGKTWDGGAKRLRRKGHEHSKRGKIERIPGASIAEAMSQGAIMSVNETYGVERLEANVMRQLARYARGPGGKYAKS